MICVTCLSLFSKPAGFDHDHHESEEHLRLAAAGGCKICMHIHHQWCNQKKRVLDKDQYRLPVHFKGVVEFFKFPDGDKMWATFKAAASNRGHPAFFVNIELRRTSSLPHWGKHCERNMESFRPSPMDAPWSTYHIGPLLCNPKSTGHPDAAELASSWLKTCLEGHSVCVGPDFASGTGWNPKRLVDVTNPRKPRLVVTTPGCPGRRYATLSHCWGQRPNFLMLSSHNEEQFRQIVPLQGLPKTFRDAIFTTKRLGIDYLWIDSLCILQTGPGCDEDWREHVTAMRDIYQQCVVNIAADYGSNPHTGMFVQRSPVVLESCDVFWDNDIWSVAFPHQLHGGFPDAPLTKRAWVFQERILSPRVIHFGSEQIYWECNEITFASESMPEGLKQRNLPTDHFSTERLNPFSLSIPTVDTKLLRGEFHDFVTAYAKTTLTYMEKDTYAAFAGIASRFGTLFGHDYVAGHFRSHLPTDLLWSCGGRSPCKQWLPALPYRAPTWSWASLSNDGENSSIDWPFVFETDHIGPPLASVVSVKVDLVDKTNRYGPLRSAEITLSGVVFECFRLDLHPTVRRWKGLDVPKTSTHHVLAGTFAPLTLSEATREALMVDTTIDSGDGFKYLDIPRGSHTATEQANPLFSRRDELRDWDWGIARSVVESVAPAPEDIPNDHPFLMPLLNIMADDCDELMRLGHALALPIVDDMIDGVGGILLLPACEGPEYFKRVGVFTSENLPVKKLIDSGHPLRNITII